MAYPVEREANKSCPIDCVRNESSVPKEPHFNGQQKENHHSNTHPDVSKKEMNLHELLLSFPNPPLIPCETAVNLLKIESKFVSSHPCLCTSRFRHTLHQLDVEHHQELDRLCNKLPYVLNIEDGEGIENAYSDVIPFVFGDIQKLEDKITRNESFTRSHGTKPLAKITQPPILHLLNNIVSRLVTEYRAIFAIEVEFSRSFEKSDDEFHPTIERKRHEEVDNCPEEIKSMKVACEELSLECSAENQNNVNTQILKTKQTETQVEENVENEQPNLRENNNTTTRGPKFCLKSLTSQEMPEKDNSIHRSAVAQYNSALEDTRSHHRRSNHHFIHHSSTSRTADEKISIALTPVKVLLHEEEQDVIDGLVDTKCCGIHDNDRVRYPKENDTTTDSVSSDVEQNPSPRRTCLRKRKERRDSIGDGQDHTKLCKSSSDVFPSCLDGQKSSSCLVRRVQSTINIIDTSNNNKEPTLESNSNRIGFESESSYDHDDTNNQDENVKACVFYVSEDDDNNDLTKQSNTNQEQKIRRAIVKPCRRSRKSKLNDLAVNVEPQTQLSNSTTTAEKSVTENEKPKSPILLPWKKSFESSPVNMCSPVSLVPVPVLTSSSTSIKSSKNINSETNTCTSVVNFEFCSDSSSSSTEDNNPPPNSELLEYDDEDQEGNGNNINFSVKTLHYSPSSAPVQDLHQQVSQPISWEPHGVANLISDDTSSDLLDSEIKHFGLVNSRQHLDRWIQSESEQSEQRSKMKKISRQLTVVRRKIEDFEIQFEDSCGYRPSQAEKQNNKSVRKLLLQQNRLKRQIRLFRESGDSGVWEDYNNQSPYSTSSPINSPNRSPISTCSNDFDVDEDCGNGNELKNTVRHLEESLEKDREECGRPLELGSMSPEQVIQEKQSIQRALNQFKDVINNTSSATDQDRQVLKELLQRYRTVKRLVRRSSNVLIKDPCELETIPEGSEIQLTLASPQHRISIEMNSSISNNYRMKDESQQQQILDDLPTVKNHCILVESTNKDLSAEQNLHALTRIELLNVQRTAKEEKKQLKRLIKEKEVKFLQDNGRPMPKDDIKEQEIYGKYKMVKAKIKLVDALLSKKM